MLCPSFIGPRRRCAQARPVMGETRAVINTRRRPEASYVKTGVRRPSKKWHRATQSVEVVSPDVVHPTGNTADPKCLYGIAVGASFGLCIPRPHTAIENSGSRARALRRISLLLSQSSGTRGAVSQHAPLEIDRTARPVCSIAIRPPRAVRNGLSSRIYKRKTRNPSPARRLRQRPFSAAVITEERRPPARRVTGNRLTVRPSKGAPLAFGKGIWSCLMAAV